MRQIVDERCTFGAVREVDLRDHLARYYFASTSVKGQTVLDIACGTGYGTDMLRKAGALSVIGVDVDAEAVQHAQDSYGGRFLVGSITDFDEGAKYDRIVSFETVEHVEDYRAALSNLRRLLKPTGRLILSTPNRIVNSPHLHSMHERPRNRYHRREFSVPEMVASLREAGFTKIETYGQKQRWQMPPAPAGICFLLAKLRILQNQYQERVLPLGWRLQPRYSVFVAH